MNKNKFRLVFNQPRGLLMAVAEIVKSNVTGDSSASSDPASLNNSISKLKQRADTRVTLRPLAFSLLLVLGMVSIVPNPLNITNTFADIIADPSAPAGQRSMVINAANGVPLINIQTPSASGVSRNTYSQFDVNSNGAILNNSRINIQTQLGGVVQGNPYLATGTARIILNEVNSHNPSLLNGYVEVAGSRAQVVIANPAGISCNGCGFINANRATLTTGTPIMNSGDLIGYRIGGGTISFFGTGLDASQADYTDIISRAVQVNTGLWANNLSVISGSNQVKVASNGDVTSITPIAADAISPKPTFAIDVAALGGMYAGKIHLIGTESGLGVNNAGIIAASVGEVSIDVNGQLTNRNRVTSTTQTAIQATDISNTNATISAGQQLNLNANSLSGDGSLLSGGNIAINLSTDYTQQTQRQIQANGDLSFTTNSNIVNQGNLLAGNSLTLSANNITNGSASNATAAISASNTYLNATGTLSNHGLIDGSDTFIYANTLSNIGTGAIFGDHVALHVDTLNNLYETVNGNVIASTIAARNRLDIGANTINNQVGSLIFSAGDMAIGGALDTNHEATVLAGQAATATLINRGATIEALANLTANVTDLQNLNVGITTQTTSLGITAYDQFTPRGQGGIYNSNDYPLWRIGNFNISWRYGATYNLPFNFREYWRYLYIGTGISEEVVSSHPAQLFAGSQMTLRGNVTNNDSKIIAGGLLNLSGATLNNLNSLGTNATTYAGTAYYYDYDGDESCGDPGDGCYDISTYPYNPANLVTTFNLPTVEVSQNTAPIGSGTVIANINVSTLPNNSLFHTNPNPANDYLIETDPRFANYRTWISSDYLLSTLSYDPTLQIKRLGDGFYEQRLIREQINQLTGRRFLVDNTNDEAQYQALMNNGVTAAQQFNLTLGIALSAEQVAQLTSDIVWLVTQTFTLPNGSTIQALVPQVYVRLQPGDISNSGSLLAGQNLELNITGNTINSGHIGARNVISLNADTLENLGGNITANQVSIAAQQNINNLGGSIAGNDALTLQAGHDINIASTTQTAQSQIGQSQFSRTNIERVAGLYVNNANGILVASADQDINLQGAQISNSGSNGLTALGAGNNINLSTLTIAEQNNSVRNAKNYIKHGNTQEIGSVIQTSGDILFNAEHEISARGANVSSEQGVLSLNANKNISIVSGIATSNLAAARTTKKSGTFSSKKTTSRNTFNDTDVISSTFSGNSIDINAGGDFAIRGSNVVGTDDVNVNAQNNITIESAQAQHDETRYYQEKKSGFSTSSTSVGYGTSKLKTTNDTQTTTNVGSTVGSVTGDVNVNAGKDYTQTASDILTPQGDINIMAQNVTIQAGEDSYANQQSMKYKQTGITLAISNPIISAIQTAEQMSKAASNTSDSRMQALAAGTTALAASNAADAVIAGYTPKLDENGLQVLDANSKKSTENPANQVGGVNVSISIGISKSSSKSEQTSSSASSSHLNAGGDINITAKGAGKDSDINIIGSHLVANDDVTLKADDQINLLAAQNVDTLNSKNKNSSASVGASFGTNSGFAMTAGVSQGKGKTNGNGTTWTETIIQSGNQNGDKVTLDSGTDTHLIGAQVIGNQIIANVGTNTSLGGTGNLNITSLQDTNQYKNKQKSVSVSVSIPIGVGAYGGSISASSSKAESNYASVVEQGGIMAGDGGFQVNVAGNTNLKGAVIASTEQAVRDNKNSLTTQTLTTSNIENKAEYKAKASSATVGAGSQGGLPQLSDAGIGHDEGKTNSVSVSAISQGAVNITDSPAQQALTGQGSQVSVATLNRDVTINENGNAVDSQGNSTAGTIAPIFDAEKVAKEIQAQVEITQTFSHQANQAVGTFVQKQRESLHEQLKKATEDEKIAIKAQLSELRIEEQVMNVLISAVTGMGATALTKESLSLAADQMRQITIESSKKSQGITDGTTELSNLLDGKSDGVRGDSIGTGGTRLDFDLLCGTSNERCVTNDDGSFKLNDKGQVQWDLDKNKGVSLAKYLTTEDGKKMYGTTGGIQGWIGTLFGIPYQAGSWQDKLIESFGGTHDVIGGQFSGLYDAQGNATRGRPEAVITAQNTWSATGAIIVSTPFAMAEFLPPAVWQAISALLEATK